MFPVFCLLVCILSSSTERIGGVKPHFCDNGYSGLFCKNKCQYPFYGKQCHEKCLCKSDLCNFIHGCQALDSCPNGYTGSLCSETCTYPFYGPGCQKHCLCPEERCHFAKGCTNAEGYSVVKKEADLKTNSKTGTSDSSREHNKTTKTNDQTQNKVDPMKTELNTDRVAVTTVTPEEYSKFTRFYSQTHNLELELGLECCSAPGHQSSCNNLCCPDRS